MNENNSNLSVSRLLLQWTCFVSVGMTFDIKYRQIILESAMHKRGNLTQSHKHMQITFYLKDTGQCPAIWLFKDFMGSKVTNCAVMSEPWPKSSWETHAPDTHSNRSDKTIPFWHWAPPPNAGSVRTKSTFAKSFNHKHIPLNGMEPSVIISLWLKSTIPIFYFICNPHPPPHSSTLSVLDGGIRQDGHFLISTLV